MSHLTDLFGKLSLSDADATDGFPGNVVIINVPLPLVNGNASAGALDACVFMEVMVTGNSQDTGGAAQDPLRAAMQDLATPVSAIPDPATLEEIRVKLLDNATKMTAMKRRAEAN